MTYQETLAWLHSMPRTHSAPTLERVRTLLSMVGDPQNALAGRFLHVTGTNGKGSACAFLSSALRAQGYRVGRFISPFIMEFRERMEIDGEIVEAPLKTKNSYRTVSIGADAIEVLKEQRKKVGREIEYVFPSPNGGPISPDSVLNMLHRVLERAGLPKIRFHDLRHTFATLALQNGVDIKTVSGMLGHFSAGFTLDTYAHVTTSAQKEAANTMGNVLSKAM